MMNSVTVPVPAIMFTSSIKIIKQNLIENTSQIACTYCLQ